MDENTKKELTKAARLELKIDYDFTDVQRSLFIQIHQRYLDWDDRLISSFSEGALKEAEKATKKYKSALRDCGFIGDILTEKIVETAFETIRFYSKLIEDEKEYCQKIGIKIVYSPKRGNPGNPKLRFYISQMAGWYKEFFADKPGYGTGSIFPRLVSACLARIEDGWDEKDPPYKAIKNVLKKLDDGPIAAFD
jgi:hypothetical protein